MYPTREGWLTKIKFKIVVSDATKYQWVIKWLRKLIKVD